MRIRQVCGLLVALVGLVWLSGDAKVVAQVYAPQPPAVSPPPAMFNPPVNALPIAGATASPAGTGNPFWQSPGPRPTLLSPQYDDQVRPASFDQALPSTPPASDNLTPIHLTPTPAAQPPAPVPQPYAMPSAAPVGMPAAPSSVMPPASPPPVPLPQPETAPQQQLSGLAILSVPAAAGEHPLAPAIRWADDALRQMQGLRDYTATFMKREFIDGRLQEQQVMYAKVRNAPQSVYLQFLAPGDVKGQEALYVAGQNGGNLRAHPVGFKQALVGTISLPPNSPQAMEGNRHPITDFGVKRLLERYLEGSMHDAQFGECEVRIIENAAVNDRICTCIEVKHPQPRREFDNYISRLYVDNQWNIPIRYESYDWPRQPGAAPQLVEEYTYAGLRLNVGLSDADFDERNPSYRF